MREQLIITEDFNAMIEALEISSGANFGVSWMPIIGSSYKFRIFREDAQLWLYLGQTNNDGSMTTLGEFLVIQETPTGIHGALETALLDQEKIDARAAFNELPPEEAQQRLNAVLGDLKPDVSHEINLNDVIDIPPSLKND